ncbi:ergothioneine biosynthesis protein EgtB [Aliikangiella sp. G2MR2-5]|uniref:ergothioneine biosynthesis protein EgtB n=1 Tax=Aliikangiella sp. G2MR2-5 TaxID=2788943 RepID=UPI0018A9CA51|nr:ergothioneine biosynthesis protein EgtB [Aliikangiella sp. G2MR2-5]
MTAVSEQCQKSHYDVIATEKIKALWQNYQRTRDYSLQICSTLSDEDIQSQSMSDASPLKWHLAHTTWAFETFILKPSIPNYQPFNPHFEFLFNSYYNAIGAQYPRANRGLLIRPTRSEVETYRRSIDKLMKALFDEGLDRELYNLIELLIHHEQQHQELMFTDFKHLTSFTPFDYQYFSQGVKIESNLLPVKSNASIGFSSGLYNIGSNDDSFYFDNEGPRHRVFLEAFAIDSQLVSNREYLEFIDDGGYQEPSYWLSEAWYKIKEKSITHPLYWQNKENKWLEHTFSGEKEIVPELPVKHINYFEANAFASWKGKRLPSEYEWEVAAQSQNNSFNMMEQLWQWTSSSYNAYPGFKTASGAIGEYNGKFMVNQYVLRGGSVATPADHIRTTYRNFFYPGASWQFTGIRLAETL